MFKDSPQPAPTTAAAKVLHPQVPAAAPNTLRAAVFTPPPMLQRARYGADPRVQAPAAFPFEVEHTWLQVEPQHNPPQAEGAWKPWPGMAEACANRQGLVELMGPQAQHLIARLTQRLSQGSVPLSDTVMMHDLQVFHRGDGYTTVKLAVTAPAEDGPDLDFFEVPLTVCEYRPNALDAQHLAQVAYTAHLQSIDPAYQDSVYHPMVLSSNPQGMARAQVVANELKSRVHAGSVINPEQLQEAVREVQLPGDSAALGVSGWAFLTEVFKSLGKSLQDTLQGVTHPDEARLRAGRRHRPQVDEPQPKAVFVDLIQPSAKPAQMQVAAPANPGEPSLVNMYPLCRPQQHTAYIEPQIGNLCAVSAINTFFQCRAVRPEQVVRQVFSNWNDLVVAQGMGELENLNLPGLAHPRIVRQLCEGKTAYIRREEFLGAQPDLVPTEAEFLYGTTPASQWRALELYAEEHGMNQGNHADALHITPDLWLSAATGLHLDQVEQIMGNLCRSAVGQPQWQHVPTALGTYHLNPLSAGDTYVSPDDFEIALERAVSMTPRGPDGLMGSSCAMVCMVQGHYYTVARTPQGDWVRLSGNGAQQVGMREPLPFAKRGQLGAQLRQSKVLHVICQCLPVLEKGVAQAPVQTPAQFAPPQVNAKPASASEASRVAESLLGLTAGHALGGLYNQAVLEAVATGRPVQLNKADVLSGPNSPLAQAEWAWLGQRPEQLTQQWRAMVNLASPQAVGLNWVNNPTTMGGIQTVTLQPDQWLQLHESSQRAIGRQQG